MYFFYPINSDLSGIQTALTTTTGNMTRGDANITVYRGALRKSGNVVTLDGSISCAITLGSSVWSGVAIIPTDFCPKAQQWGFYVSILGSVQYGLVEYNTNGLVKIYPLIGNLNARTQITFVATWIQ